MNLQLEQKTDHELSRQDRQELRHLLQLAFTGYFLDRLYHKQIPNFRILAKSEGHIIGHAGIEYRVVHSRKYGALEIFGITDLCVAKDYRNKGIGTRLLKHIEKGAKNIDAIILFADEQKLYANSGYFRANVTCKFLAIEEHESLSVLERNMIDCFMIKCLKESMDMNGDHIDMLGHVF